MPSKCVLGIIKKLESPWNSNVVSRYSCIFLVGNSDLICNPLHPTYRISLTTFIVLSLSSCVVEGMNCLLNCCNNNPSCSQNRRCYGLNAF